MRSRSSAVISWSSAPLRMHLASSSVTWPRVSFTTRRSVHGHAAVELVALHQRAARGIDFDFERDAELVAVAEHGVVR